MRFPIRFLFCAAIAAAFAGTTTPRAASAAITSAVLSTENGDQNAACPTTVTAHAIVQGTPGQTFLWIVNYQVNGVAGSTSSTPFYSRIMANGTAALAYKVQVAGPAMRASENFVQFNTQTTSGAITNYNSNPISFTVSCFVDRLVGSLSGVTLAPAPVAPSSSGPVLVGSAPPDAAGTPIPKCGTMKFDATVSGTPGVSFTYDVTAHIAGFAFTRFFNTAVGIGSSGQTVVSFPVDFAVSQSPPDSDEVAITVTSTRGSVTSTPYVFTATACQKSQPILSGATPIK